MVRMIFFKNRIMIYNQSMRLLLTKIKKKANQTQKLKKN